MSAREEWLAAREAEKQEALRQKKLEHLWPCACGKKQISGTLMEEDGRCADCHRHPAGTPWRGGTIPDGCQLYVMPRGWRGSL